MAEKNTDVFILSQVSGMNSFTDPGLLSETSYARGVNINSRGGVMKTRPRFTKVGTLPNGRFQGIFPLANDLYVIVSGEVHKSKDGGSSWTQVPDIQFSPYVSTIYCTAVYSDYLFMNDGVHMPAIVGPYANRHLSKQGDDPEIPCGSLCCFGQGRIFFFSPNQKTLMAGDVYKPGDPSSCLKFTEQAFLNESLAIRQPAAYGRAMSMQFVRNSESGTGLGQLVVFYENGYCAYNVYHPRSEWLDQQMGQSLGVYNGAGGHNFLAQKNNDLLFRTGSGITTLRDYTTQTNQGLRTLPLSIPIGPLLERDQTWTLEQGSINIHDNLALFTHGLRNLPGGDKYYDTLIPLDMTSFYNEGNMSMTFDGLWIGPRITKVFTGMHKGNVVTYVSSKVEEDNGNALWILNKKAIFDDVDTPPRSRWYSRVMSFGSPFQFANFYNLDLWLQDMKSDVTIRLFFRSEDSLWQESQSGTINVPYYTKDPLTGEDTLSILPQGRSKIRVAITKDLCNPVNEHLIHYGSSFQFCLEVTGAASVPKQWYKANVIDGDTGETRLCEEDSDTLLTTGCTVSMYDYDQDFLE